MPTEPRAARTSLRVIQALVLAAGALPWALALLKIHTASLWFVFHSMCHQRPERTLSILGEPMLVCSRCAGVFAGLVLGVLFPFRSTWLKHGRRAVVLSLVPAIADVITQDLGLHPPWHWTRIPTGLLLGWTASAFMFGSLRDEATAALEFPRRTADAPPS